MFVLFSCIVKLCHINYRNCNCEQRKATYDCMRVSVSRSSCPNFRKFSVHVNCGRDLALTLLVGSFDPQKPSPK